MGKNGFVGTVPYMAPEMLIADSTFGLKVDSYGFACIIFETLAVKIPWHGVGQKQVVDNVVNQRKRPEIPEAKRQLIDREPELQRLEQLMARCWAQRAAERPTFNEVSETALPLPDIPNAACVADPRCVLARQIAQELEEIIKMTDEDDM